MAAPVPLLAFEVTHAPGVLVGHDLIRLFELLVGDDVLVAGPLTPEYADSPLDPDGLADSLAAHFFDTQLEGSHRGKALTIDGADGARIRIGGRLVPDLSGRISGTTAQTDHDGLIARLLEVCNLLDAPHAMVSSDAEPADFGRRAMVYLDAAKADKTSVPTDQHLGSGGAVGVAYRSILGPPFVELYGADTLAGLEADGLASPHGSYWVVAGSDEPDGWDRHAWGPDEHRVIETLGPHHFFDPATGTLPRRWADLPEAPGRPVLRSDPATAERYVLAVDGSRHEPGAPSAGDDDPSAAFAATAAAATAQMTELVPEFPTDDQLHWVEEFLADRPAEEHPALVATYGAWLGEYLRTRIDGTWAPEPDGAWAVVAPDGTGWNAHGRVAKFLVDRNDDLKSFVAAATSPR